MSKVIRFKDDGSYSLLDIKTFITLTMNKRLPQSEELFKYVWRSKTYGDLRYAPGIYKKHQSVSLSELPEFVRALIVIHNI